MAGQELGQGAFSGAVRPHDRVNLARLHGEVDATENFLAFDRGVQIPDFEHRPVLGEVRPTG